MKLFNTLTRTKEDFIPLKQKVVKMYSCGPTVYSNAHIGNMRTYIFMDILRRTFFYNDYEVVGVMNITDVGHLESDADEGEDKMERAAKKQQKSPYEIAEKYTKLFFEDLEKLNIGIPEYTPKATEHIAEMIDYVKGLQEKGYAYETSDGIYFDISKFADYGKLSGINLEDQLSGARVEVNENKRNPYDFALWKKAPKEHIMQWESPWGMGFPGWHIECSAMSKKYLGSIFDIHTGGIDHVPIHHENEIAQSEALEGFRTVNYWMHGEFMQVNGGKMSKSLDNVYTISELEEKGYEPLDFRYFCLNTHYRKKLNFTFEAMTAAKISRARLNTLVAQHRQARDNKTDKAILDKYLAEFEDAINDDLNVPLALGVLWTALKEQKSADIYLLAIKMDKVFGLSLDKAKIVEENATDEIPADIMELANKRAQAKKERNFALADSLRNEIMQKGYTIIDLSGGAYKIEKY